MRFAPQGYTYAHEHLHIDLSAFKGDLDCRLDQYALICEEMKQLRQRGVANIVEVTNRYMGRNAQFMLDLMQESGINIIASTGYYQQDFYPQQVSTLSSQQLADEMVAEIEIGIDGTSLKAGVIAEIGSSVNIITDQERKVFYAAALAHQQTGRPISTHTSFSTMGVEQVQLLIDHGVAPGAIVIGHCDLRDNLADILRIIELGAYVQFDTIGKNSYYPDGKRILMLQHLAGQQLLHRVILSMDVTRRSHLAANGGNGFCYLIDTFIPQLLDAGLQQTDIDLMLRDNPRRFFTQG
ncbi:MAG: phosphotriesterase-related protein [Enterobacteriaceae bacterium]